MRNVFMFFYHVLSQYLYGKLYDHSRNIVFLTKQDAKLDTMY